MAKKLIRKNPRLRRRRIRENPNRKEPVLEPLSDPELVFGLVGPIGTDLRLVETKLAEQLETVNYSAQKIHVTDALKQFSRIRLKERPLEAKYASYIAGGNLVREKLQRQDALALLSVIAIRKRRAKLTKDRLVPASRTAYILRQFKRPEEIRTLRQIYGRGFVQISAYCSQDKRADSLTRRIASSHFSARDKDAYAAKAQELIATDNAEEEIPYGQRVRDTFPLADVVINADSSEAVRETCARFIRGFFGDNFCTPSRDEYGMYLARSAALRSSDLSRQVGAAIALDTGEIIALGCNEVPRAGGGVYWENDSDDYRDFKVGYDSSVRVKREILEDVFRRLKKSKWFNVKGQKKEIDVLVNEALDKSNKGILRDAQLMDILEFGRIVHAEMVAILAAVRTGVPLLNATLFCTTFPCHICARHIVAAGIKRVVYIEPFSKSLASDLYPDSIVVENQVKRAGQKVKFEPFIGVAPERFAEFFSKGIRKDDEGNAQLWVSKNANPILKRLIPAYIQIESAVAESLVNMLRKAGL